MNKNSKIVVFGATGLVGSAIVKKLLEKGYTNIIGTIHKRIPANHHLLPTTNLYKVDLLDSIAVQEFFKQYKPEFVFLAAAKVGGIVANNIYRADFIYENLQIQNNIIYNAYKYKVKKLMFLGSTCIYPKNAPQPMREEYLLTSELEYTNEPYAIAKIAGIKMCESFNIQYNTNFISVMPTNLYGPNDNFDLEKSHVLPALIRKIYLGKAFEKDDWKAIRKDLDKNPLKIVTNSKDFKKREKIVDGKSSKEDIIYALNYYGIKCSTQHSTSRSVSIEIWGTGNPMREFLWSEDMADACIYLMEKINIQDLSKLNTHFLNIGTGKDISIKELAELIKSIVGFKGKLFFNANKPDGTMKKVTDVTKLNNLGWRHKISLKEGIEKICAWYVS